MHKIIAAQHPQEQERLSLVLPLTFSEIVPGGLENRWRQIPNHGVRERTLLLFDTLERFIDLSLVETVWIICPARDLLEISTLLSFLSGNERFQILEETSVSLMIDEVFCSMDQRSPISGWSLQQIIKLAAANIVKTSYYMTLDSDLFFLRTALRNDLFHDQKAIVNVETYDVYKRLYKARFAEVELHRKRRRYKLSASILDYHRCDDLKDTFYGETPVLLHTSTVQYLMAHISERMATPWTLALYSTVGWSEYSLYFQFAEMVGSLNLVHYLGGPNSILDLERSIWQKSEHYKRRRLYDKTHFTDVTHSDNGIAVAIQSWLPVESWMPPNFDSLSSFYSAVRGWILGIEGNP